MHFLPAGVFGCLCVCSLGLGRVGWLVATGLCRWPTIIYTLLGLLWCADCPSCVDMLSLLCIDVAAVVLTASVCVCVLLLCVDSKYWICLMYNIAATPQCIIGALFFFWFLALGTV